MMTRPSRWRALLETQWKWTRGILLLIALTTFAIPLLSLRASAGARDDSIFISSMQAWAVGYAFAAAGVGLLIGVLSWSYDHRLRHVYALSLPIERWRYSLMRFTGGLALIALPVATLFVSAEIVAHSSLVPPTLHAYPVALTLRFAFAALVAYSVFFAISSATARTAGYILGAIGLAFALNIVLRAAGSRIDLLGYVSDVLLATPGLLAVFGGRWMLVDV
jgi:hypothetical protein